MVLPTHIVAVGGIVRNEKNEILLVKNPRKGWEFPGGIVENGETLPQGVIREIKEESGIDVEVINLVGIYSSIKKKKGYNGVDVVPTIVNIDFICKYVSGDLLTSEESLESRWFSEEEALELVNKKQFLRFKNALEDSSFITCMGYEANKDGLDVKEEYLFKR